MQAHENLDPINRTEDCRRVGSIALGPSENGQGGYYFVSLETGKKGSYVQVDRATFYSNSS